jgi:CBS domain-containing protein
LHGSFLKLDKKPSAFLNDEKIRGRQDKRGNEITRPCLAVRPSNVIEVAVVRQAPGGSSMTAKDIMTADVIAVKPTVAVRELARTLIRNQISGAPVIDTRGKIVGVVSEADIVAKKGKDVRSIMSKKVIGVAEDTEIEEIAKLMATNKISRVPVLRDGKLKGIISRADIVNAIAMGKHIALHTPVYDL